MEMNKDEFFKSMSNGYEGSMTDLRKKDLWEAKNYSSHILQNLNLNPQCLTLKDLIDGLYRIFESDRVNIEEVYALMTAYKSNTAEWVKYAKFDRYRYIDQFQT